MDSDSVNEDIDVDAGNSRSYPCNYPNCNMVFRTSSKMSRHYRTHDDERPFQCSYASCGKTYTRAEHLRRHELVHTGVRPYQCSQCPQAFRSSHHLKRHIRTHDDALPFTCENCSSSFAKAYQLREHMFQHTNVKGFACETCEEQFVLRSDLSKHVKREHREKKLYKCQLCDDVTFNKMSDKARHMSEAHANRFVCSVCQKRFASNARLNWHRRTHDPSSRVSCPQCLKTYSTQANLQTHIRAVHEKIKAFVCDVETCRRAFALKKGLQRHTVKIHLDPKPKVKRQKQTFKTVLCGQDVASDDDLSIQSSDTRNRE